MKVPTYHLTCTDCVKVYVVQTVRSLNTRFLEHLKYKN